jgi:hypothetical protein
VDESKTLVERQGGMPEAGRSSGHEKGRPKAALKLSMTGSR